MSDRGSRFRLRSLSTPILLGALLSFAAAAASPSAIGSSAAEAALLQAVNALRAGEWRKAQDQLMALTQREPTFKLAQLLLADLLAARSGNTALMQSIVAGNTRAEELIEEYRVRVQDAQQPPAAGTLPDTVLRLSGLKRSAIVVDLPRSRLYVLQKNGDRMSTVASYYASIARKGFGKAASGDLRTPVGIYHATGFTPGAALPPLYGSGAFPLDYPNLWDRARGRTGYGIWLHGVPFETYVRPPRTSEGCVVLANEDLLALKAWIAAGDTPVVFSDGLQWREPAAVNAERAEISKRIEQWRAHWSARDVDGYSAMYAPNFVGDGMNKAQFSAYKRKAIESKRRIEVQLDDLDLFRYPGEKDLVLAEFTQVYRSDALNQRSRKQQFWQKGGDGQWRIVREDSDTLPQTLAQR